jgi:hypothetical protein
MDDPADATLGCADKLPIPHYLLQPKIAPGATGPQIPSAGVFEHCNQK